MSRKTNNLVKFLWFTSAILVLTTRIAQPALAQDFNGDGKADLAIGVPNEDVGGEWDAGVVIVIYGSGTGLVPGGAGPAQIFHQNRPGIPEAADDFEQFGRSLAWGDFNGDGKDDLAIGVPGEAADIDPDKTWVGAVVVIYGSPGGLNGGGPAAQLWHQDSPGIPETADAADLFGSALAAGDFNGDGKDDLAIGAPGEYFDHENFSDAGAGGVNIIYGSPAGLAAAGAIFWSQNIMGGGTTSEVNDNFGARLTSGDFNGDGKDDLAIGVPLEDFSDLVTDSGEVDVLYGNIGGLGAGGGHQIWTESSPLIGTGAQSNNVFGSAIAAGDFDGDGDDDFAVSAPGRAVGALAMAGKVYTLKSSPANGIGGQGGMAEEWHLNKPGIPGDAAVNIRFGESLASGDFNGDNKEDLALGCPFGPVGAAAQAGFAIVIYGSENALKARIADGAVIAAQMWHQNRPGVPGAAAVADTFGWPLAPADFNGDNVDDLAIGVVGEMVAGVSAGAVNVIYGAPTPVGLSGNAAPVAAQIWHQNRPGVPEAADANDAFGVGLNWR